MKYEPFLNRPMMKTTIQRQRILLVEGYRNNDGEGRMRMNNRSEIDAVDNDDVDDSVEESDFVEARYEDGL